MAKRSSLRAETIFPGNPAHPSCRSESSGPQPVLEREMWFTQNECVVKHWLPLWVLCCWEVPLSIFEGGRRVCRRRLFRRRRWRRTRPGRGLWSCALFVRLGCVGCLSLQIFGISQLQERRVVTSCLISTSIRWCCTKTNCSVKNVKKAVQRLPKKKNKRTNRHSVSPQVQDMYTRLLSANLDFDSELQHVFWWEPDECRDSRVFHVDRVFLRLC